ncbi:ribosome maturation factor RimP [Mycoplasmatota bacterium]|nr:ribosome maturation factor RimP [Mycoplasmatota bacterium]
MNKQIKDIIIKACEELELDFYDLEYKKEHSSWVLRVLADTKEGIKIEECVELNRLLCDRIGDDLIPNEYNLEVSSPGIERKLRNIGEVEESVGKYVFIKTFEKINNQKEFYGYLHEVKGNCIYLDEGDVKIPYDKVATIRLAIKF